MKLTLEELEDYCLEIGGLDYCIFEQSAEHQITLEGFHIHVPELDIDIYPSTWLNYCEAEQDYQVDYGVYLFFPSGEDNYIYSESYSTLYSAIRNYLKLSKSSYKESELTFEVFSKIAVKPNLSI